MEKQKISARKLFLFRIVLLALLAFGLVCAIIVADMIYSRIYFSGVYHFHSFSTETEIPWVWKEKEDRTKEFTVDPEFGFRPILGVKRYSEAGTLRNSYTMEKRPGVVRLLFIGDSTTEIGRVVRALRFCYGEEFEYWNAGVSAFATVQEVAFYKRYNRKIAPDHVILGFHNSDFRVTAAVFFDNQNQLVIYYTPQISIQGVSPWLLQNSSIYRLYLGSLLNEEKDRSVIESEVEAALLELKNLTMQDGAKLTVLVLPILKPYQTWSYEEKDNQKAALKILEKLNIRHFDLSPIAEQAINAGIEVQEIPGDSWHPNDAAAILYADFLKENNLLP
ncbi:MAG: hypothetical protein PHD51_01120 [Patescibacteria group bacterium]|nr:hypothetical protein [Patescibacteria group bacterium]MDD5490537.1 hypothetical protein [Patescibacteria group bacterium]